MKDELRQVYLELSNGRLTQTEALERIKAIKSRLQEERHGVMLLTPQWEPREAEPSPAGGAAFAEHHLFVCELPGVNLESLRSTLPEIRCEELKGKRGASVAQRYERHALVCFEAIQTILRSKTRTQVLVQIAVADREEEALFAGLVALLKSATLENPSVAGQLILVPADATAEELAGYAREGKDGAGDVQLRYGRETRHVLRWREASVDAEAASNAFRDDGVYLITGGAGRLGLLFAAEILAATRHARAVLTGRSPLTPERQRAIDALGDPARVTYRPLDLGALHDVQRLVAGIQDEQGRLDGILHSAGMLADTLIVNKTAAGFRDVLAPKVAGTVHLDEATRSIELDFFVLFSSIAGALGNVGQADYATANAFMDHFAQRRNRQVESGQRHGRTRSINWSLWEEGGMTLDAAGRARFRETMGLEPLRTAEGVAAFHRTLALPCDQVLVVDGDVARMRRAFVAGRVPAVDALALPGSGNGSHAAAATETAGRTLLEKAEEYLRDQCSEVLKLPAQRIDPQAALEKYGIDSILAMKLTSQLERTFGSLSKTLFFEYQTIRDLAHYFVEAHEQQVAALFAPRGNGNGRADAADADGDAARPARAVASRRAGRMRGAAATVQAPEPDLIAIIGLSGRYPEAVDIAAYWKNLREGKDCIIEVPQERWDWREYYSGDRAESGHHYSKWGGFIAGVDEFDPLFFNIAPKEARLMDPQERLFLQHAWMAIEDAGYTRAGLQVPCGDDLPGQVGVYAGVMYTEYQLFGAESALRGNLLGVAGSAASIANRVSYAFNLHGPSVTLDTMCSSSLTAIHFACQDLKLRRTSLAIAGGVNVSIHPNKYLVLSAGQFISSDGHCQSFGEGGDGYIPGEGVGVVVLKRLSDAERDGDHIYAVIRGSALNHGGKTNGYTVPNPQAQAGAIARALAESNTDARHVSYIEAHGTGTKLGDPIEIAALGKAFRKYTEDSGFCLIGSAKSNIGHCESAAGIAGLTKVLLQMQQREIVPSLHSATLNPHIDFAGSPFVVNQTLRPWEQPVVDGRKLPRVAGISSFGAGGSNAHLIVEEYQRPVRIAANVPPVAVLLSARTAEQLEQKARDLLAFVQTRVESLDLVAMAYTLQVGREAMDERVGFVVRSAEELSAGLLTYLSGGQVQGAHRGQVRRHDESTPAPLADVALQTAVDRWIADRDLSKLVELWVAGGEVDWTTLYTEPAPQRISLPTYPFARERFWIDIPGRRSSAAAAPLHPLLHQNTSDLTEQRYSSEFSGEELFLADHQIRRGEGTVGGVFPAVACLEMARAAIAQAVPEQSDAGVLELRETVWSQPVIAAQRRIAIAISPMADGEIAYEVYGEDGSEDILCEGRAVISREAAPSPLDLERLGRQMLRGAVEPAAVWAASARSGVIHGPSFQGIVSIRRGDDELLAHLQLPRSVEQGAGEYALHPTLIESALRAAALLDGDGAPPDGVLLPFALRSLRILGPCTKAMVAWVRSPAGRLGRDAAASVDVDLCDEQGTVRVQLRGLRWHYAPPPEAEQTIAEATPVVVAEASSTVSVAMAAPREIPLTEGAAGTSASSDPRKPARIALATPAAAAVASASSDSLRRHPAGVSPIVLASHSVPLEATRVPVVSPVRLYDRGDGVLAIEVEAREGGLAADQGIAALCQALARAQQEPSARVLIISGVERCFAGGGRDDHNAAVAQNLYTAVVAFPYPVMALLKEDTVGAAFLFAALCDFMVCNEEARYGYTDARRRLYPTSAEAELFEERFGAPHAQELLYVSTTATGRELRARGWTCPVAAPEQLEACTGELASALAAKPAESLRLLKAHLTRRIAPLAAALARVDVDPAEDATRAPAIDIAPASRIRLHAPAESILAITIRGDADGAALDEVVAQLRDVFTAVEQGGFHKAIVLSSEIAGFLPGAAQAIPETALLELQRAIFDAPVPVVAALEDDVAGDAWLAALVCDSCVYGRTSSYSSAGIGETAPVALTAAVLFRHRFGDDAGAEILLTGAAYSGLELQRRAGAVVVADRDRVAAVAQALAESWIALPMSTLAAWKRRVAATIRAKIGGLDGLSEKTEVATESSVATPTPVPLHSAAVTVTAHPGGVVVVSMEDRETKNMFSEALMAGMKEAFAHVERTPSYKVVVLTGYDQYFASGGTKETLLAIQAGKARFTDSKLFQLPFDCSLPVIAAMHGHGIGAGWSLGMFADVAIFGEESRYVSPYMAFGFTPGAGATWSLPAKIGVDLARESLLTARDASGAELKARGLVAPVLPRADVLPAAMALAAGIARMPRRRSIALKRLLTADSRESLEEVYRLELAMHERTFVGRPETLARILDRFEGEVDTALRPESDQPEPRADGHGLPSVRATLKTLLADELQMRESDIDDNAQFVDLGLDSISGVSWVRKINQRYRTSIDATRVYSYPTLAQLSRFVQSEAEANVAPAAAAPPIAEEPVTRAAETVVVANPAKRRTSRRARTASRFAGGAPARRERIAVIGMAGQFPQARDLDEFWRNLAEGRNCIAEVPHGRWDVDAYYQPGDAVPGKTNSRWVGALEDYDRFDPLFFNISPTEAELMDPQQRLFLQACWHGIEDAGYDARVLSGSRCGVFVGCATGDYHQLSRAHQLTAQGFTGNAASILAARISYFLNLQGPCVSIDTACSSSLVAIAQACDSLSSRDSDLALAGGVYVMAGPEMHIRTAQAGMLSPEGKCFAFDQRADGFVPGEGVGVVVLKRLADALVHGDIIHGVIEGWGVNQDGKTNGITAPNPESQTRLEQEVYDRYAIDPANIQLIEAHGTGTKLGDPIEVEGLKAAFRKYTQKSEFCAVGSVKSNIGHCLTAAGVAGVLKLLLALRHRKLPPTIHFERLNEHIDLAGSPFFVNTQLRDWELDGAPYRQAAVSSFGFSGTNAHIVVGESPAAAGTTAVPVVPPDGLAVVPLSARTAEQLQQRARQLLEVLRRDGASANLFDIAYTLQVGRAAMDERLGIVVSSVAELSDKLEAYLSGAPRIEGVYAGQVKRNKDALALFAVDSDLQLTIDKWMSNRKLPALVELWARGVEIDWNKLHGDPRPRRIPLPAYPFARERYWIEPAATRSGDAGALLAVLHPLVHRNTSDLSEHRYSTTLTGEEAFLEHEGGCMMLPRAACLEMARAAVVDASRAGSEGAVVELRDVVWGQPLVFAGTTEIRIALLADDGDRITYEISSGDIGQEVVHCQGRARWSEEPPPQALDLAAIEARATQIASPSSAPPNGRADGSGACEFTAIHRGSGEVLLRLRLPKSAAGAGRDYVLPPLLLEDALRTAVASIDGASDEARSVVAVERLRVISPCADETVVWARHAAAGRAADEVRLDIDLCDLRGEVCAEMRGVSARAVTSEPAAAAAADEASATILAVPFWRAEDGILTADSRDDVEHHVILCDAPSFDAAILESLIPGSRCAAIDGAVHDDIARRYAACAVASFERIQAMLQRSGRGALFVQIVALDDDERALHAGLSAMLRSVALEHPYVRVQLILAGGDVTTEDLGRRLAEEKHREPDVLVRLGQGSRQVCRWRTVEAAGDEPASPFRDDGVYLITGGAGGLGMLFAREIVARTIRATVVLIGRSEADARIRSRLDEFAAYGGRVTYRRLDLDDLEQARQVIAAVRNDHGSLTGILHCAGMTADNVVLKKTAAEFHRVLAPKVAGTFHLDQATEDVELDFFVLFGSIAGAAGNAGQCDYAAANAFMDQFATYRNRLVAAGRRHGRTRAIDWSLWASGGMSIDRATEELVRQTTGIHPMGTETGLRAFDRGLALPYDQLLVVEGLRSRMTAHLQKARMLESTGAPVAASPRETTHAVVAVPTVSEIQQQVRTMLAAVLRMEAPAIDVEQPFVELGLDSFLGAELVVAINKKYGTELSHLRLFDYTTVRELSLFVEQEIRSGAARVAVPAVPALQTAPPAAARLPILEKTPRTSRRKSGRSGHADPRVAIVGMSGRYPGADDLNEYWANLAAGKNSIGEVPRWRWDVDRYYDPDRTRKDKTNSRWLGAIDDIECFDPLFFRISPQEAEHIDPQHRLFLQESYRAFEDAGYSVSTLSNAKCGVYLGISTNEYMSLLSRHGVLSAPVTSNSFAIAAARIAYYLNLKGPAISVDTACSSSLVAVHLACQALLQGEIDMALAGGVSLWLAPDSYVSMSQAGMFSASGQCKTFDDDADGIVNGEGVGAVVLRRLEDAEADGDVIHGVILASGINQDGRTNGITAPSMNSQMELERSIYAKHGIDPETITCVEAHGTGTRLGDPIELEALATVFREKTSRKNFCALGSVKSNIGHTTSAAGVAGLQKVLLSIRHRTLVPTLNVTRENSRFDFASSPFYVSRETKVWDIPAGTRRRAAVSSFGFSGTNSHLVVEEYASGAAAPAPAEDAPLLVPLSARTAEQLRQKAADLLEYIRMSPRPVDLASVAYTLQVGREAMEERVAFVVRSVDQLAEKLAAYAGADGSADGIHQGRVEPGSDGMAAIGRDDDMQDAVEKWIARNKLATIADFWVRGLALDWNAFYGATRPRRISLPTYPFAKERCWIGGEISPDDRDIELSLDAEMRVIEDIFNQIDADAIDTRDAVHALRALV